MPRHASSFYLDSDDGMGSMIWICLIHTIGVYALPHPPAAKRAHNASLNARIGKRATYSGEPPTDRTIFTLLSLFCIMVLSLLLGSRFGRLRRNAMMKRNITSMLVLLLYFLVMSFVTCSSVMLAGQGLFNYDLCFSATWICLILYTASKGTIYIFLVERVHVVRAPFVRRSRDWLYWGCMIMVIASFAGVSINAYLRPIINMEEEDGRCHMGIPGRASIPFMVVDILVDIALTAVFFWLLRPVVKLHGFRTISGVFRRTNALQTQTERERNETAVQRNIRILLWKSLIGSMLIMLPTIANMVQFYITQGRELALICLTICVIDVCWDAVVIHWLTFGSMEAEKDLTKSVVESMRAPLTKVSVMQSEAEKAPQLPEPKFGPGAFDRKPALEDAIMPVALV